MASVLTRNKPTECICPICRKRHWLRLYFTGRGIPRKYCEHCSQKFLKRYRDVIEEYRISADTPKIACTN